MRVLVVYDATGYIVYQASGDNIREPVGIPYMWVEVPVGKRIASIDVSGETHIPIFEDLPKNEIQLLQEQVDMLYIALAYILGGDSYATVEESNLCQRNQSKSQA